MSNGFRKTAIVNLGIVHPENQFRKRTMFWKKIIIETKEGKKEAICPEILSASRGTDIPAFHTQWFMNRWEKGYVKWVNPFNRKSFQYISFTKTRALVFWSKNPRPLMPYLSQIVQGNIVYYFQFTLNDYGKEGLEPQVPPLKERIEIFKKLSEVTGPEKVIWRYDPLILGDSLGVEELLDRIGSIGNQIHSYTKKLVFSFANIGVYKKVQNNLRKTGKLYRELTPEDRYQIAKGLSKLAREWNLEIATCAETDDLSGYGIKHNSCIDGELLLRLSHNDPELMRFMGVKESSQGVSLFDNSISNPFSNGNFKDKGQRPACGCIFSKDIGQYDTCPHLCTYCYANTSEKIVKKNMQLLKENPDSESILP